MLSPKGSNKIPRVVGLCVATRKHYQIKGWKGNEGSKR